MKRKITYFSRRLISNHGGGEQCDLYLLELLKLSGHDIQVIHELSGTEVYQSKNRNFGSRVFEELSEILFYMKNYKAFLGEGVYIFTGRSLAVSLIAQVLRSRLLHNIHGKTNKIALWLLKASGARLIFWGVSYKMNKYPDVVNCKIDIFPSSHHIRNLLEKNNSNSKKNTGNIKTSSKKLSLVWVGRVEPIKNPLIYLELLKEIDRSGVDWESKIVGGGSLMDELVETSKKMSLDIQRRNVICGEVSNHAISSVYNDSDILVVTSKTESFSIVIIEALLNGLRVVSCPIPELVEGPLGRFITFSQSCAPRSIADSIFSTLGNRENFDKHVYDYLRNIYEMQRGEIIRWLG